VPGQCLDVSRVLDVIAQRLAQLIHSGVNAVFEVNESIGGPESLPDLFPGDHFAGALKERCENLERPFLKLDLDVVMPQFTATKVSFEVPDPEARGCRGWYLHGGVLPAFESDVTVRQKGVSSWNRMESDRLSARRPRQFTPNLPKFTSSAWMPAPVSPQDADKMRKQREVR
jgi:hypothetical protein